MPEIAMKGCKKRKSNYQLEVVVMAHQKHCQAVTTTEIKKK